MTDTAELAYPLVWSGSGMFVLCDRIRGCGCPDLAQTPPPEFAPALGRYRQVADADCSQVASKRGGWLIAAGRT